MELAEVLRALRARKLLVGIVIVVAVAAAVGMKEKSKSIPTGQATTQILVDSPQSALADLAQDTGPLATRATVYAQLMTSGAVLQSIAHAAGVPANQVTAEGPYSGTGEALDLPTPSEARGAQLLATRPLYHLMFLAQQELPVITVTVNGPTPLAAARVANAVYPGLRSWLSTLQNNNGVQAGNRVTIRQLGDAQAGSVSSSSGTILAGVAGLAVIVLGLLLVVLLEGRRVRRAAATPDPPASIPLFDYAPFDTPEDSPVDRSFDRPEVVVPSSGGFGPAVHEALTHGGRASGSAHPGGFAGGEPKRTAQAG